MRKWQETFITVKIYDNIIVGNQSLCTNNDWATGGVGGGIDLIWTNSDFKGNIIVDNKVDASSKGYGAGMRFLLSQSSQIRKNTFLNNYRHY